MGALPSGLCVREGVVGEIEGGGGVLRVGGQKEKEVQVTAGERSSVRGVGGYRSQGQWNPSARCKMEIWQMLLFILCLFS